jgi:malonyl-CoA O-methyltransferase
VRVQSIYPQWQNCRLMTTSQSPPTLDATAVDRWQRIAPATSPWLHEEVASRMLDRLQWVKLQPKAWAHWGAVRGGLQCHAELTKRYPDSISFVAEDQQIRAQAASKFIAKPWWKAVLPGQHQARFETPPAASVDMLWANMALHEAPEPQALLGQWHQALRVGGFLMFSCLGPDTAIELRNVYRQLGWPPAGHDLTDMHDWGDMLVQAGFAEPVMDMERITLTYDSPARLLAELAELGRNFHPARFANLRGRGFPAELERALAKHLVPNPDGRLALTFEVIYGHALKPQPKVKVSAQSAVSIQDMRSMLNSRGAR